MPENKTRTIRAVVKYPNQCPHFEKISTDLEDLLELVGGYLEEVVISEDMVVLCDEEGYIKGKPYNCKIGSFSLFGTIVFVCVKDNDWSDIPFTYSEFVDRIYELSRRNKHEEVRLP